MPRFFIPRIMAEQKVKKDHVPYFTWEHDSKANLYLTDGDVIDPKFVRQQLAQDARQFRFVDVGYDPTGLEESRQICEEEHGWNMVPVPQKPKYLGGASAYLERLILGKQLRHSNNPIFNWCLSNAATKETADGLFVYKGQGETQRIDGVIAAIIGLSRLMADEGDGDWLITL